MLSYSVCITVHFQLCLKCRISIKLRRQFSKRLVSVFITLFRYLWWAHLKFYCFLGVKIYLNLPHNITIAFILPWKKGHNSHVILFFTDGKIGLSTKGFQVYHYNLSPLSYFHTKQGDCYSNFVEYLVSKNVINFVFTCNIIKQGLKESKIIGYFV